MKNAATIRMQVSAVCPYCHAFVVGFRNLTTERNLFRFDCAECKNAFDVVAKLEVRVMEFKL